ncbi:MAG: HEAT repeat domain-containing protein [Planctomycetia bacterium]|nr:HEAT repeat domain-containing protein [Planctomycetia bacterium]
MIRLELSEPAQPYKAHCHALLRWTRIPASLLLVLGCYGTSSAQSASQPGQPAAGLIATPARFEDLVRLLDNPRPEVRLEAINHLGTLNRPSSDTVPALVRRFEDSDLAVRVTAVKVALRCGMPAQYGVTATIPLLNPAYPDVCCNAAYLLGEIGPPAAAALPQLRACLGSTVEWVRLHAARAALRIDATDAAAVKTLRQSQQSERDDVREFAARALGEVVDGLIRQLSFEDPGVRRSAVLGLEQLGAAATESTGALLGRLADPDPLVRVHAARAVHRAGVPPERILGVVSSLLDPERFDVLRVASQVLSEIGPAAAEALPALHECLKAHAVAPTLYAAEAALRIDAGDRAALKTLRLALGHPQVDVRYFAVNALGVVVNDSQQGAYLLQQALTDANPRVATAAALHLSRTHDLLRNAQNTDVSDDDAGGEPTAISIGERIDSLSAELPQARRAAAIRLGIAGRAARAAVPVLTDRLGDSDPVVRLHVAQALWEIDHNGYAILPVVVDLLLTNAGDTRIGAVYVLGRMGVSAIDTLPWLTQALHESKSFDRLLLAEAVLRIEPGRREALDILAAGLRSPSTDVRFLSTVAIGSAPLARQAAAEEALSLLIDDGNARVRCAAYESLSQLQVRKAVSRSAQTAAVEPVAAREE